ncbi:hypothetical protein P154DRAFT_577864 [Amniculicola lignicola CBS 123094]|uniref:Uncharacterized protein n=1 Tax=Amniculicola lignicola CBS 123094 TaxID=1392246 RepID=A0A6A5W9E0_9PLEO|nr:hypothetical protein P154DRAFT_577864 [Amniculicola lignicola CBS 123094]
MAPAPDYLNHGNTIPMPLEEFPPTPLPDHADPIHPHYPHDVESQGQSRSSTLVRWFRRPIWKGIAVVFILIVSFVLAFFGGWFLNRFSNKIDEHHQALIMNATAPPTHLD